MPTSMPAPSTSTCGGCARRSMPASVPISFAPYARPATRSTATSDLSHKTAALLQYAIRKRALSGRQRELLGRGLAGHSKGPIMRLNVLAGALLAAALFVPSAAFAASDSQLWTNGVVNVKLSDRWRLSEEMTGRFSDNRNGLYEIESNTLLGYRLNKVVTLWAGYTHNPQYSAGDFAVMEHRAREQVTFDGFAQLGKGKLSGRLR